MRITRPVLPGQALAAPALAQVRVGRTVRRIAPCASGGPTDLLGRPVAVAMPDSDVTTRTAILRAANIRMA